MYVKSVFCWTELSALSYMLMIMEVPVPVTARSKAARLLRSWVRIPPRAWMSVWCECCVLSGRGLCDELITRPKESYRMWYVVVCYLEKTNLVNEEGQGPLGVYHAKRKKWLWKCVCVYIYIYIERERAEAADKYGNRRIIFQAEN